MSFNPSRCYQLKNDFGVIDGDFLEILEFQWWHPGSWNISTSWGMGLRSEKKDILRQQIVRLCHIEESVFSFLNSADVWDSEILSLQRRDAFAGNSLSER